MTLLLQHWFHISPAVSGFILNLICYVIAWRLLGKEFIAYSFLASTGFSVTYKICEMFDPLWPQLADMPLLAAVSGSLFVGIGYSLLTVILSGQIVGLLQHTNKEKYKP